MRAIYKKELRVCALSLTGPLAAAVILLVTGLMFRYYNLNHGILTWHYAVSGSTLVFYIVTPVLAMRLFSEERRQGTEALLLSSPVSPFGIVLGKYLAAVTVFAAPLLITAFYPLIMTRFGGETLRWDYACLGVFFLMGCVYLSVGMFFSSLTESPVIAAILAVLFVFVTQMMSSVYVLFSSSGVSALLFLTALSALGGLVIFGMTRSVMRSLSAVLAVLLALYAGYFLSPGFFSGRTESVLRILDFSARFTNIAGGILRWSDIAYFLSYTAAGLILTWIGMEVRRDGRVSGGTYFAALTAGLLAGIAAVNLIVQALPDSLTTADLSSEHLYSVGDVSRSLLSGLTSDVDLYVITEAGREDESVEHLVRSYDSASERVTAHFIDAVEQPGFARETVGGDVTLGSVIAVSGGRAETADYAAFYLYDSQTGQTTGFDAEGQITSAISRVTDGRETTVCYTSGHGELAMSAEMLDVFAKSGIRAEEVNLLTGEIPETAAALIMFSPMSDLTDLELRRVRFYLENGGHALLVSMPEAVSGVSTPGFDSLLADYGVKRSGGLAMEENASAYVQAPYFVIPRVQELPVTSGLAGQNLICALPEALYLTEGEDSVSYAALPVLSTSPDAYLKESVGQTVEREEGDQTGSFDLAVCIEETPSADSMGEPDVALDGAGQEADGDGTGDSGSASSAPEDRITRILYFTTPCLFSSDALSTLIQEQTALPEGNTGLFSRCMAYLTDRGSAVAVPMRDLTVPHTVLPSSVQLILGNLLMLALPAAVLLAGAAVFIRRRRR